MKFTTIIFSTLILISACKKKDVGQKINPTCAVYGLDDSLQKGIQTYYPFCGNAGDVSGNANDVSLTGGSFTANRLGNDHSAVLLNSDSSSVCSSHAYDSPQNFT